jgi:anti-anti-sigma regulatory factor
VSLADCRYCDASCLRTLLGAKHRLGKRLSIVVPRNGSVRRIFELTELTERLELYDDIDLALRAEAASS